MNDSLFKTGVRPLVDQYLLEEAAKVRDYGEYWSASSAGYCMRKLIFEKLGVPEVNPDARKQRVFTAGHVFHEWMQTLTRNAGVSVAQEAELQDEDLMVRGHFDDLILIKTENVDTVESYGDEIHPVDSNLILYDYKTQNSKAFTYQKSRPSEMSHFHHMQLGTYMYMLRKEPADVLPKSMHKSWLKNLEESRILKISKDDLRMSEQQLMWSEALEREVVGFWSTLNGYWKNKQIPRCSCAQYESGFMAKEAYNPFWYGGEPCSIAWYELCKREGKLTNQVTPKEVTV